MIEGLIERARRWGRDGSELLLTLVHVGPSLHDEVSESVAPPWFRRQARDVTGRPIPPAPFPLGKGEIGDGEGVRFTFFQRRLVAWQPAE